MNKYDLQPLSGFRDIRGWTKEWVIDQLKNTFRSFGYEALETPALEKKEILLSKYGDEAQKLLYLFEDLGQREIGLRYDLTLPLARYVADNFNTLVFPFKRYEIGNAWRAEKPQKGRFRQFTQADVDILGEKSLEAEVELFKVIRSFDSVVGLQLKCILNDRRLTAGLLEQVGVAEDKRNRVMQTIDKRAKIDPEAFNNELSILGLSQEQIENLLKGLEEKTGNPEVLEGLEYLKNELTKMGIETEIDLGLVRGLDYYTGTVFELVSPNYDTTLIAGGRYDCLVEDLIGEKIPGVGVSFGVDRIADLLGANKEQQLASYVTFVINPQDELEGFDAWIENLRKNGKMVDLYIDKKADIGTQLKYANRRGFKEVIIPLKEEWEAGKVILKNMETGEQLPKDITSF